MIDLDTVIALTNIKATTNRLYEPTTLLSCAITYYHAF